MKACGAVALARQDTVITLPHDCSYSSILSRKDDNTVMTSDGEYIISSSNVDHVNGCLREEFGEGVTKVRFDGLTAPGGQYAVDGKRFDDCRQQKEQQRLDGRR